SASRRKAFTCRPKAATATRRLRSPEVASFGGQGRVRSPEVASFGGRGASDCARQILTTLARRAYRRPATAEEMAALLSLFESGRMEGGFDDGVEMALWLMLARPQFLVRGERESEKVQAGQPYAYRDLELDSRLTIFMWI